MTEAYILIAVVIIIGLFFQLLRVLYGILTAIKNGFNEVIKALESVDARLGKQ